MSMKIVGASVIMPDAVVETDVLVEDGVIAAIGSSGAATVEIDGRGQYLAPAMIDIHGDAFERQVMPRPNVFFPMEAALLDTDRQLAANGIATAYHALTLSWEPGLRSVDRGRELIHGIAALKDRLTVENRVQLRWETFAFEAVGLMEETLEGPLTPSIAFNDHTSMSMRAFEVPIQEREVRAIAGLQGGFARRRADAPACVEQRKARRPERRRVSGDAGFDLDTPRRSWRCHWRRGRDGTRGRSADAEP